MKRYAAFFRGINISGKNKIAMADLKKEFAGLGFRDVSTVLNSGNVLFSSECESTNEISAQIVTMIHNVFGFEVPVCVVEYNHLLDILSHAPAWWKRTATVGIAEKLTIRTANTIKKLCK